MTTRSICLLAFALLPACSEATGKTPADAGAPDADLSGEGLQLSVPVGAGKAFVDLAVPAVLSEAEAGSTAWDLAFEGYEVTTNGGVSGPGQGSSFGPLAPASFLDDFAPEVPFMQKDETGGAFLSWWIYEPAAHVIWSRYHTYGVKDGERIWKVQVLGFYGEVEGAPVPAMYSVRWAEVTPGSPGAVQIRTDIDGTAGGKEAPPSAPSGCLDLGTGELVLLTPAAAATSSAWHLCFRRDAVSVNGGLGGPRGVEAVDLDAAKMDSEKLEVVKALTAESTLAAFEAVTWPALTDPALDYSGDRVVSAFTGRWIADGTPPSPKPLSWYVVGGDGASRFLLAFDGFEGASAESPGTIDLRVKAVE